MLFTQRISTKQLGHRLGMALEAGVDLRTVLAREADRATGPLRSRLLSIRDDVAQGASLTNALANTQDYFPELMHELVQVGEESGHLDGVFSKLSENCNEQLALRRQFLGAISWPCFQLLMAICVIGGLIWGMGILRSLPGNSNLDILGFGLYGNPGLFKYLTFLILVGAGLALVIRAIQRGALWIRPLQYFLLNMPGVGRAMQTLALSRLAWTLHLTMDAGMDLRRSLKLSLQSTRNLCFIDQIPTLDRLVMAGNSLQDSFRQLDGYPVEFLDTLAVAEDSGRLVETLGILARQYQERAKNAVALLTNVAGILVWLGIASIIIFMIFRVFGFYLHINDDALKSANQGHF
jgi:type IV pilus assembly protein PilC